MFDPDDRRSLVRLGTLFEGGLALFALGLAWLLGVDPHERLSWNWMAVAWGVAGVVPPFLLFLLAQRFPIGPLLPIKRFLVEMLGPLLVACRWYDLVLLAVLAGGCEELLFRGVLQPWLEQWGYMTGLIGSNILFGLAHLITPMYAVWAGLTGVYLGLLLDVGGDGPNLLIPGVTHALYDWLAFLVIARTYRREQAHRSPPSEDETGNTEIERATDDETASTDI